MMRLVGMFALLAIGAAHAETAFDADWTNRVDIPMAVPVPGFIKPAEAFDEQQAEEEIEKRSRKAEPENPSCQTLQQARRKHPSAYLSWKGNHCWFAPSRRG